MDIRVFRSGKGDCLLLTHGTSGRHILIDGGVPDAYEDHWASAAGALRDSREPIELVCISHIDRDHIGGVLKMLDNEVAWRLYAYRRHAARSAASRERLTEPTIARPPEIRNIWHNAFLESVRASRRAPGSGVGSSTMDVETLLFSSAAILAAAAPPGEDADDGEGLDLARLARQYDFLGQSVGDAIEVSRRISAEQLDIPRNRQYAGQFVVRRNAPLRVADFSVRVLGPTNADLRKLKTEWNAWLDETASHLRNLQRRHDRDADRLRVTSSEDVVDMVRESALALSGNQNVTPPNLASIVMLVSEGDESILLTGDADDEGIIKGLKAADLVDADHALKVGVFKVPHHGAHNSYSDDLARSVIADHYVFCGNGKHSNPEVDIIESYLRVLFEGDDDFFPALGDDEGVKFWFNCGPSFFTANSTLGKHWRKVESRLEHWKRRFRRRFRYKFMSRGHSFLVR